MKHIKVCLYLVGIIFMTTPVMMHAEPPKKWLIPHTMTKIQNIAKDTTSSLHKREAQMFLLYYEQDSNQEVTTSLAYYPKSSNTHQSEAMHQEHYYDHQDESDKKNGLSAPGPDRSGLDAKYNAECEYILSLSLSKQSAAKLPPLKNYITWKNIATRCSYLTTRLLPIALPVLTILNCSTYFIPYSLSTMFCIYMKNQLNEMYKKYEYKNSHPLDSDYLLVRLNNLTNRLYASGKNIVTDENNTTPALPCYSIADHPTPS